MPKLSDPEVMAAMGFRRLFNSNEELIGHALVWLAKRGSFAMEFYKAVDGHRHECELGAEGIQEVAERDTEAAALDSALAAAVLAAGREGE